MLGHGRQTCPCLQALGADAVIDYRSERFEEVCRHALFDIIVDPIGGGYTQAETNLQLTQLIRYPRHPKAAIAAVIAFAVEASSMAQ